MRGIRDRCLSPLETSGCAKGDAGNAGDIYVSDGAPISLMQGQVDAGNNSFVCLSPNRF